MPTRKSPIAFILACSLSCLAFTANAEEANETVNIHAQHHQELLEAQSNLGEEINLIDSVALQHLEEVKEMLFPAADIYGNIWNKERVNPYNIKGMELPDSANIDVSDYCIPAPGYITSNYGWRPPPYAPRSRPESTKLVTPYGLPSTVRYVLQNMNVADMATTLSSVTTMDWRPYTVTSLSSSLSPTNLSKPASPLL